MHILITYVQNGCNWFIGHWHVPRSVIRSVMVLLKKTLLGVLINNIFTSTKKGVTIWKKNYRVIITALQDELNSLKLEIMLEICNDLRLK